MISNKILQKADKLFNLFKEHEIEYVVENNKIKCNVVLDGVKYKARGKTKDKAYSNAIGILYKKFVIDNKLTGSLIKKESGPTNMLHIIGYKNKFNFCKKCNSELITTKVKYLTSKGKEKDIIARVCEKCNINYVHINSYTSASENGTNPYLILDAKLDYSDTLPQIPIKEKKEEKTIKSVSNKPKKLDDVWVYKNINNHCTKNHPEFIKRKILKLKNVKTMVKKEINGFHCEKCNKSFITVEALTEFTEKSYVPLFRCNLSNEFTGDMKEISMLALYGYTARKGILSDHQRRNIIDFAIKYKIMTELEIINLLEHNIKLGSAKGPSMTEACEKWHDDIQYIYKVRKNN